MHNFTQAERVTLTILPTYFKNVSSYSSKVYITNSQDKLFTDLSTAKICNKKKIHGHSM